MLRKELGDAGKEFDASSRRTCEPLDAELQQRKLQPVPAVSELKHHDQLDEVAIQCVRTSGRCCGGDADRAATERD